MKELDEQSWLANQSFLLEFPKFFLKYMLILLDITGPRIYLDNIFDESKAYIMVSFNLEWRKINFYIVGSCQKNSSCDLTWSQSPNPQKMGSSFSSGINNVLKC